MSTNTHRTRSFVCQASSMPRGAMPLVALVSLMVIMALPAESNAQSLPESEVFIARKSVFTSRWDLPRETTIHSGATSVTAKHIPNNAVTPRYTEFMASTDRMLAIIFGGQGAVASANGFEPEGLSYQYPLYRGDLEANDGRILRGHLSCAMHLYGSQDGTGETEIYVPVGFISHSSEPTPTDAVVTFYYPRIGNLTDVTLAVFHVANFRLSYEAGRVRIGNIGGPGGSKASYKHSHFEFYRGNTGLPPLASRLQVRIDPKSVFELAPDATTSSRSKSFSLGSLTLLK
jgi:hypothetical protein